MRIAHARRGLKACENSSEVVIDRWNAWEREAVLAPVRQVADTLSEDLNEELKEVFNTRLQASELNVSSPCFDLAGNFVVDDAEFRRSPQVQHVQLHTFLQRLHLSQSQVAKIVARFPHVLGYSIQQT